MNFYHFPNCQNNIVVLEKKYQCYLRKGHGGNCAAHVEWKHNPKVYLKPNPSCKACRGTGEVSDIVDWGATTTQMMSLCDCVTDQVPEDYEGEIELDLSDLKP